MGRQELKCEALACVYNRDYNCSARAIEVKGGRTKNKSETFCETFTQYEDSPNEIGMLFSVSGETNLYNMGTNKLPGVYCSAVECKYNENQFCKVPSLKIGGMSASLAEDTLCESYELRESQQSQPGQQKQSQSDQQGEQSQQSQSGQQGDQIQQNQSGQQGEQSQQTQQSQPQLQ